MDSSSLEQLLIDYHINGCIAFNELLGGKHMK